jgi:hypothetical protein
MNGNRAGKTCSRNGKSDGDVPANGGKPPAVEAGDIDWIVEGLDEWWACRIDV